MGNIFDMFGPSPIRPIEQHMYKTYCCAKQLFPFFQAVIQENWDLAESLQSEIIKLEKEADGMKRDLRLHLRTGLFLPVERSDLLELLAAQDRIANKAEDIAELIVGRKMIIPKFLVPALTAFLERSLDAEKFLATLPFTKYKLVQWIGDLADLAQIVGSRLQILIAR